MKKHNIGIANYSSKFHLSLEQKRENNENLKRAKAFVISLKENVMNYVQITELLNMNGFKTSTVRLFKWNTYKSKLKKSYFIKLTKF